MSGNIFLDWAVHHTMGRSLGNESIPHIDGCMLPSRMCRGILPSLHLRNGTRDPAWMGGSYQKDVASKPLTDVGILAERPDLGGEFSAWCPYTAGFSRRFQI